MNEKLKNSIEAYKKIDWDELLRKDLGDFHLEPAKKALDAIKKLFDKILDSQNLDELPNNYQEIINLQLGDCLGLCRDILSFGDTAETDNWIQTIKHKLVNYIVKLSDINNYIQVVNPAKDENIENDLKEIQQTRKKLKEELEKTSKLLDSVQGKAINNEISKYGGYFKEEAEENKKRANKSFRYMMVSIGVTLVFAAFFFWYPNVSSTSSFSYLFISKTLIKFVVISLGFYLIAHFSKIHSAEKHLYNINTQKQNALESHQQILQSIAPTESENEKEIRNAILLELTRAIFDPKDTGYSKTNNQISSPTSQIVEISKSIPK